MATTNRKWLRDMSQYDMDALGERKLGVECYCKCDECIAKWLNEEHVQGVTT